jgi:hypothetical protein
MHLDKRDFPCGEGDPWSAGDQHCRFEPDSAATCQKRRKYMYIPANLRQVTGLPLVGERDAASKTKVQSILP